MIEATCFTNDDTYAREHWPKKFIVLPQKGDWIQSESGRVLKVCGITFGERSGVPYIEIELTRRV